MLTSSRFREIPRQEDYVAPLLLVFYPLNILWTCNDFLQAELLSNYQILALIFSNLLQTYY